MSKELEEAVQAYYEHAYDVTVKEAEYAHEMGCHVSFPHPESIKQAFAAGRALGRREVKGEAADVARNGKVRFITRGIRNHLELDDVRERIASAIEAIPED